MSIFDPVGPYALKHQSKPLSASRLSRWLIYTSSGDISTALLKLVGPSHWRVHHAHLKLFLVVT